jgi:uncharacterized repeat protein (TIGR01451 family)
MTQLYKNFCQNKFNKSRIFGLRHCLLTIGILGLSLLSVNSYAQTVQCAAPLAAVLQTGPTGVLSLNAPTIVPPAYFVRATPTNLVANGDFETFANAALRQGPFTATLIDPAAIVGAGSTNPQAWATNKTTVPNWTVGGGNKDTYSWHGVNSVLLGTPKSTAPGVGAAGGYIYLGMSAQDLLAGGAPYVAPFAATAQGRIVPPGVVTVKTPNTAFQVNQSGGPAYIEQTVTLTVGRQYRMTYYVAAENLLNASNYSNANGIMALDISGYAREYLTVQGHNNPLTNLGANGLYYTLEFTAKQAATTVRFSGFGHAATVTGSNAADVAAEPSIDDVIINLCAVYTVSGNVYNDVNGLTDNLVNGTGTEAGSTTLTAYLVRAGLVVAVSDVSAGGVFTFANIAPGTGFTVVLSNSATVLVGAAAPAASLPVGWINTGENNAASTVTGNDGAPNGISAAFDVVAANVIDRNFGIRQLTAALTIAKTDAKATASSGGTNNYVVTLSNAGPDAANGAIVTDTAGAGLTCPAASPVTCAVTGAGAVCPAGALTFANLTAGLTVPTLPANGALTFSYTCSVI